MTPPLPRDPGEFTVLLRRWSAGDKSALDQISGSVYQELRRLAATRLRLEKSGHTLQATALLHEAYLRLVRHDQEQWHSRAHFFGVASHIMREILVDYARKHAAQKRGSGERPVAFDDALPVSGGRGAALIALDDALAELAVFDERKSRLIELKYFGGMDGKEIAEALGISVSTVTRESRLAEAWLHNYLKPTTA